MKFKLTSETKDFLGIKLFRIEALVDFGSVKKGDKGGWVEREENLSQTNGDAWVHGDAQVYGGAWVYGNAQVYGDAHVYGDAQVRGSAQVSGDAQVYGDAVVFGNAHVSGNARVYNDAVVYGDAQVSGNARGFGNARVCGDARVSGNARVWERVTYTYRSDGYKFHVFATPGGPRILAGCRWFKFNEAEAHWIKTRGGTPLGDESLEIVRFLKEMSKIRGLDKPVEASQ